MANHRRPPSRVRIVFGALLLVLGAIAGAYPLWWNYRSHAGAEALLKKYDSHLSQSSLNSASGTGSRSSPKLCTATPGPGVLAIPAIGLVAPVQQGIDDAVLNVSVGHNPSTAWPGPDSAALLAAHDVSFFSALSELKLGDIVTYAMSCSTYVFHVSNSRISQTGTRITVPSTGAIVLDTCWPTNALWFTPNRLIVTASYTSTIPNISSNNTSEPGNQIPPVALTTNLPPGLDPASLTILDNAQLLGLMTFSSDASPTFLQSNAPMQVENVALIGWFAAIHTLEQNRPFWWHYFAPGVPYPYSLNGRTLKGTSRLQILEAVTGDSITGVTLSGALNGVYVVVHETVIGNQLVINSYVAS